MPEEIANQDRSLSPAKVSDLFPVFVTFTLAGASLDAPTFVVQLKPVGLTANIEGATQVALATPEPYTEVQAPAA